VAEQVRSGIQSLPRGQTHAGLAMGFTLPQVYRHVTLPMAFRIIIPPMTSEFLTIFKNSSTALTIGVLELTAQSRQISEYTFKTFEAFTAATLIYIVITMTVIFVMRALEKRVAVPGYIAQGGGH
jgi:glutamate/aspartate transport system permease protein